MGKRILLLLVISGSAFAQNFLAQEIPDAPSVHHFWDATNRSLLISHVALEAVDSGITHRNLSMGGKEMNNMAKTLCESGTPGQVVYFAGRSAGVVGISYLLHRMRHHKLERLFIIAASVDSAYGVTYSFAHK